MLLHCSSVFQVSQSTSAYGFAMLSFFCVILHKYGQLRKMIWMLPGNIDAQNNYQNILYRDYLLKAY